MATAETLAAYLDLQDYAQERLSEIFTENFPADICEIDNDSQGAQESVECVKGFLTEAREELLRNLADKWDDLARLLPAEKRRAYEDLEDAGLLDIDFGTVTDAAMRSFGFAFAFAEDGNRMVIAYCPDDVTAETSLVENIADFLDGRAVENATAVRVGERRINVLTWTSGALDILRDCEGEARSMNAYFGTDKPSKAVPAA